MGVCVCVCVRILLLAIPYINRIFSAPHFTVFCALSLLYHISPLYITNSAIFAKKIKPEP